METSPTIKSLLRRLKSKLSWQPPCSLILKSKKVSESESETENEKKKKVGNFFFLAMLPTRFRPLYMIRLEKDGKFRAEEAAVFGYPSLSEDEETLLSLSEGEETSLPFPVCSCNGLLLLIFPSNNYQRKRRRVMLWNPFIGKLITISYSDADGYPCYRPHLYHDSTTDDYKILLVYGDYYSIYSCNKTSWEEKKDWPYHERRWTHVIAFLDGCFYGRRDFGNDIIIMCFDVSRDDGKKKPNKLKVPNEVRGRSSNDVVVQVVSGRLCLYFWDECKQLVHMWVMEENRRRSLKKRWSWKKVIAMKKAAKPNVWQLTPVCLSNVDDVVLRGIVVEEDGRRVTKHFLYNACQNENNSFREVEFDWEFPIIKCYPYSPTIYMPSSNVG